MTQRRNSTFVMAGIALGAPVGFRDGYPCINHPPARTAAALNCSEGLCCAPELKPGSLGLSCHHQETETDWFVSITSRTTV